jgi:DNA-binding transcriptional MerR regulator
MAEYTVSQLSKVTGIPPSTIRFYVREGILKPRRITDAGYNIFDDFSAEQLIEVRNEITQRKGSAIKEIKKLKG